MSLNAYLSFQGNAKEAMAFYAKALNTDEPSIMYFKDMPPNPDMPVPEECQDWVMHGSINFNGQLIMFSDVLPNRQVKVGNNMSLLIDMEDANDLKTLFDKFNDQATVTMPFEATFWSKGFGSLIDKYGIEWQFNCSQEE